MRFRLRFSDHDVELAPGELVVGRSESCQIILDDPLISRKHARFLVAEDGVHVEDLGSVNGVLVNGDRLEGTRSLQHGDRIRIGRQEVQLCSNSESPALTDTKRKLAARTLVGESFNDLGGVADEEATRQASALEMLGGVAEKVLAMGRGEEAARLLRPALERVMARAHEEGSVDMETATRAGQFAVRLAATTSNGEWLDYLFNLYGIARQPMPADVVDELYRLVRTLPVVNVRTLRKYLEVLKQVEPSLGPAERFLVRRINGLERLAVLR